MRLPAKQAKLLRSCIVRCIEDPVAIFHIEAALQLFNEWTVDDRENAIRDYMVYRRDHLAAQLEGALEAPEPAE